MKKLTLADFTFAGLPNAVSKAARFADRLMGERVADAEVPGCEGGKLSDDGVVIAATGPAVPFQLLVRCAGVWRALATIPRTSIMKHLDAFERVPDPEREASERKRRRREEERRAQEEEARRAEEERVKERKAEWARAQRVEQVRHELKYASGDDLVRARAAARELGIAPPLGVSL